MDKYISTQYVTEQFVTFGADIIFSFSIAKKPSAKANAIALFNAGSKAQNLKFCLGCFCFVTSINDLHPSSSRKAQASS